jgi:hypothetical protein
MAKRDACAIIQVMSYKIERIEASRLWNTLLVFHLPNHQPFVLGDLISENVFESIDTLSRDERDYLVFERETDISILIM